MADLGNQKIKNTYQFVLQADGSGNVQKLDGTTPSLIFNSPITYNVGTPQDGLVLKSDANGQVSWGAVTFSGDVYISGGSIVGDTIELKPSSGGTLSIPGLSFSANSDGTIGNAPRNKNVGIGTPTPNAPLTVVGGISATTLISGTQISGGTMNLSQKLGVSGKTFLGTIDAAGDSYTNDKILVAQSNGEVEYLTTAQLKADIGDEDYWTASTTGGHIINSGLTTSNVGIGTSTPNEKLTVVGSISASTSIFSPIISGTTAMIKRNLGVTGNTLVGGELQIASDLQHIGDLTTKINFGDTGGEIDFITEGGSRIDLNNQGVRLGGANSRVTTILDEDNMASDSNTSLSTQQSIKAYVDSQVASNNVYWSANTDGTISNSGLTTTKVGIGTDKPNEELTVVGDISGTTSLLIGSNTAHLKLQSQYIKYVNSNRIFLSSAPNVTPNLLYDNWRLSDSDHLYFGTGNDLDIYHDGSQSYIDNNTGTLNILSSAVKLGDTTSEVTVQDNLVVGDDLTVNTDNLYVHSTNERVGIKTLNPDAVLTVSGNSSTGFTAYNLNGGNAQFSNGFTRVRFTNGADTNDLSPGDQIQVVDGAGDTFIVNVNTVNDSANIFLTVSFPGDTINATSFNYNGAGGAAKLFKVYDGTTPTFQVSGDTVMSGTTDLLDIFSRVGMSGTVTSVAISGTDGIDVDSGSPITDSGTITLGLSGIDATKIANGSVTNTEFQYIHTLSSNAQTQLDAKLPLAGGTMAGAIAMGTNKVTGMGDPTSAQDATTKTYVDTKVGATDYWSATTTGGHIVNSGLTGNVGIGTDTPSALLDVKGTTNITQRLGVSGETAVGGAVHSSTSFVVGNATLTTSELDISSGNFTLDVEGDITIDANGADIILSDDGTDFGRFKRDTSDFVIKSETNNKDILFKGQDGGATITALQLDMSEAGTAIFNHDIVIADDGFIGSASDTDAIQIEADGDVVLSQGLTVTQITNFLSAARLGDAVKIQFGDSQDTELYISGDDFYIDQTTSDKDIIFKGTDGASDITALTLDMSEAGAATFNNKVTVGANPTNNMDVVTKTYFENNGRYIENTTFSLKILSNNNWVGFNRSTGGLNSSGFFNTDTGASNLTDLYAYYDDNDNVFFMVPYAGKIKRLLIQGGFSAGAAVNDDIEVQLAKATVSDGAVKGSWTQVTGFTKTLPDSNSKRFVWDTCINCGAGGTDVGQFDVFLLAFKGEDSIQNFITASVIMEFTYTIT